jgi:hypothetical protein
MKRLRFKELYLVEYPKNSRGYPEKEEKKGDHLK